jgi:hypothetical protein
MKKELNKLMKLAGTKAFDIELKKLYDRYQDNDRARGEIAAFIKEGIAQSGKRIEDISVKMQLKEVTEIVSLAYIARHYFQKTKSWLSQRINAHSVNGKPAKFTEAELETLNFALKDIGKKLGSVSVHH